jgi:hypothetical protein
LSGAAGDAGSGVEDPVAERFDLAARQVGVSVNPTSLVQAIRSVAAMMIPNERAVLAAQVVTFDMSGSGAVIGVGGRAADAH